ncbi:hypothetical protein FZEAL_5303 [Fusarium zealandicum]|uniref:Pyroglutamyl-peptidase 1 n=1 Tax=Fusarium zealandicum TaxID=1053134 RepID=A0A8H4UK04_9HYPO|nr:hypothetical protein FZEAL_5303 [Fusarium zealandicum]
MGSHVGDPDELTVLVTGFGVRWFLPVLLVSLTLVYAHRQARRHAGRGWGMPASIHGFWLPCAWAGPFREQYPVNPSWEIAKGLPSHLPPLRAKDPNSRHAAAVLPKVRILVHPEPIRVNYQVVRGLVPTLYEVYQGRRVDMVIHIGMAGPRPFYCVERRGHRDGYKHTDVDEEKPDEEEERKPGSDWPWHGLPEELETDLDADDVVARWQGHSSDDMDLRVSEDAGRFMCDFIYFSSLAHLWKMQRSRKVLFLHVPADASPQSIDTGRELVLNLVRSMVESDADRKYELREGNGELKQGRRIGSPAFLAHRRVRRYGGGSRGGIKGRTRRSNALCTVYTNEANSTFDLKTTYTSYNVQKGHLRNMHLAEKTSWWGCGSHIPGVLDSVPAGDRCECEPKVEVGGTSYPPMAASPN